MCQWRPPNGFTGTIHHMEAKVGGSFKMSFTNFTTQQSNLFGGEYLELIPNESEHRAVFGPCEMTRARILSANDE